MMRWHVTASKVDNVHTDPRDTGEYGWRVAVTFRVPEEHVLRVFALPVRFAAQSDCERAVEFMNAECPPEQDLMATVRKVEERFSGLMGWKSEVIPIACRF